MKKKPIVLVASVTIFKENKVLIIKETTDSGCERWNFPSGRMEYGEDIPYSAYREVKEETGLDVQLIGTTGVYNFNSNVNNQVIMFHFYGEIKQGSISLEDGISEYQWIKLDNLLEWNDEELRKSKVMKEIIRNLLKNRVYSTNVFNSQIF